jgi:hypothetical protein
MGKKFILSERQLGFAGIVFPKSIGVTSNSPTIKEEAPPMDQPTLDNPTTGGGRGPNDETEKEDKSMNEMDRDAMESMYEGNLNEEAFTRQHFNKIADILKGISDLTVKQDLSRKFGEVFAEDNPRFDWKRWNSFIGV